MLVLFVLVVLVTPGDVWISRWHCVGHHSSSVLHTPPQCFNTIMLWEISCLKSIGGVTNFAAYSHVKWISIRGRRRSLYKTFLYAGSVGLRDVSRDKWPDSTSPKYARHFVSWFFKLTFLRSVEPKMGAAAKLGSAFCIRHWASNPASTFVIADIWIKC